MKTAETIPTIMMSMAGRYHKFWMCDGGSVVELVNYAESIVTLD